MIELHYSLAIEATADLHFFGFYSPELPEHNPDPKIVIENEARLRKAG